MLYGIDADWVVQARCRGMPPDIFFPAQGEDVRLAVTTCRGCPVRMECLEYSLARPELFGIWGGLSDRQRRRIRRYRNRAIVRERERGTVAS